MIRSYRILPSLPRSASVPLGLRTVSDLPTLVALADPLRLPPSVARSVLRVLHLSSTHAPSSLHPPRPISAPLPILASALASHPRLHNDLQLSLYSLVAMIACLLTWFTTWQHADIIRVANNPELVLSTLAASLGMLTSVIGWAGILLNNRTFLAVYTLLTWVTFAFLVTPGYITYRRYSLNLEGKINDMWANALGAMGRMRIQNQLSCCGYFSPYVEATVSQTCYARSILPGCKKGIWEYEERILSNWFKAAFALVPVHICVMLAALMCSNHVTYRFGKGMMPERYRLNVGSMAVIMDQYANQLAEQYGPEVAGKVLERSKSNLGLAQTGL